jgi:hypothetical protein
MIWGLLGLWREKLLLLALATGLAYLEIVSLHAKSSA